jgi:hypothetical protein
VKLHETYMILGNVHSLTISILNSSSSDDLNGFETGTMTTGHIVVYKKEPRRKRKEQNKDKKNKYKTQRRKIRRFLHKVSIAEFKEISRYSRYILCVPDLELYFIQIPKFLT